MTPRVDPYRVLGLIPGATAGEIRSAYRRLAKMHHPDKAGERSLPRFLAIQAAYEALVDGEGNLRARGWPTKGAPAARPANPSARGASRDAWRARRAAGADGPTGASGAKADGSTGSGTRTGGAGAGADGAQAGPNSARDSAPGSGPGSGARRSASGGAKRASGTRHGAERRTAKPGSTTYDEAAQPLDPSWEGAGWYGASSGRYWTLNPKEYADPRKHGPEYQERARRAAQLEAQLRRRTADGTGTLATPHVAEGPASPPPAASGASAKTAPSASSASSAAAAPLASASAWTPSSSSAPAVSTPSSSSAPSGPPVPPVFGPYDRPPGTSSTAPGGSKPVIRRFVRRPGRPAAT